MATSIANLAVKLSANSAQFTRGMNKARKSTRRFGKSANVSSKAVSRLGKALLSAFAASKMLGVLNNQRKMIDSLAKTADKLGLTTSRLAGLHHAAELSGVGVNTFNMALQRMTRRISEAAHDTGEAKDAIKELGLSARALAAMAPDQAFMALAKAMGNVAMAGDRVRLAMKLFDSEGVALVNTLMLGEAGLRALSSEATRFGVAIGTDAARGVEKFNDAMTRLKAIGRGFLNRIMTGIGGDAAGFLEKKMGLPPVPKPPPKIDRTGTWDEQLSRQLFKRTMMNRRGASHEAMVDAENAIISIQLMKKLGVVTWDQIMAGQRIRAGASKKLQGAKDLYQKMADAYKKAMIEAEKAVIKLRGMRWQELNRLMKEKIRVGMDKREREMEKWRNRDLGMPQHLTPAAAIAGTAGGYRAILRVGDRTIRKALDEIVIEQRKTREAVEKAHEDWMAEQRGMLGES